MNLHEKLIEVRKKIPRVSKDAKNSKYDYVSSSNVLGKIRPLLDEQKILIIPNIVDAKAQYGEKTIFTELTIEFHIINAEKTDEKITISWYGQGIDYSGEKGVGKALTYAEKYLLLKLFNIPTDGDDPDGQKPTQPPENKGFPTPDEGGLDKLFALIGMARGFEMKENLINNIALHGKAPHDLSNDELRSAIANLSNAIKAKEKQ